MLNLDDKQLHILDINSFSTELKGFPEIVFDFFGHEWAKVFLSEELFTTLSKRLASHELIQLRSNLGVFYKSLFDTHDGSITNLSGENSIPDFEKRYIILDVNQSFQLNENEEKGDPESEIISASMNLIDDVDDWDESEKYITEQQLDFNRTIEQRVSSLKWISTEKNSVIIGGPGSGKSALLKYITLLLLDVYKTTDEIFNKSRKNQIPVWLPFGFWTSLLDSNPNIGLIDAIRTWFDGHDRLDLWPIIEKALNDKRLILLVDGLDEWRDEDSGLLCFQKLSVFTKSQGVSAICSSRPSSIDRLSIITSQWSIAKLCGLAASQKSKLIELCIDHRIKGTEKIDSRLLEVRIQREIQELESEILENPALRELSSIPLMIYMLIHLKTKNISIPLSKFLVYKELIGDLVKMQPKRRKAAAQVINRTTNFNENELFEIFSLLAFELHKEHAHGAISMNDASAFLVEYLVDPRQSFGFGRREARASASEILHIGESDIGILVKRTSTRVSKHSTPCHFTYQSRLMTWSVEPEEISKLFSPP